MGVDGGSDALIDVSVDGSGDAFVEGCCLGEYRLDVVEGEAEFCCVFFGVAGPGEVHAVVLGLPVSGGVYIFSVFAAAACGGSLA